MGRRGDEGKKAKKNTQRISLYRVRLEKDRDLMKERRVTGIAAPEEIVEVIKPVFDGLDREQFVVLYLNMKLHPIGVYDTLKLPEKSVRIP